MNMLLSEEVELPKYTGWWKAEFNELGIIICTNPELVVRKYRLDKLPIHLTESERTEILDYCLGVNNYSDKECVGIKDIFIHGEHVTEIIDIPAKHSNWQHYNGNKYEVILIANEHSANFDKYPVTIIYRGNNGRVWSRPLDKWFDSFTPIP